MVSEKLKRFVKEKECFNVDTGKVENVISICMNYINKYNNEMGGDDIADQLRRYYRIYLCLRNRKW